MRTSQITLGIPLGVAAYYVLSLASAFWTARLSPPDIVWAVLLGILVAVALGLVVATRVAISAVASVVMLALAVLGFAIGSGMYDWAVPQPADIVTLFFHGGRSPLVLGALAFTGVASFTRIYRDSRRSRKASTDEQAFARTP